jgi:hypothetical protein
MKTVANTDAVRFDAALAAIVAIPEGKTMKALELNANGCYCRPHGGGRPIAASILAEAAEKQGLVVLRQPRRMFISKGPKQAA